MVPWWKKTLSTATNVTGLAAGLYSLAAHRPNPKKSGTLRLHGLHMPVEVITDSYGIPHIYAQNEDDLYFAQGYLHAQDRLWQMEFNRRLGAGRLAEIFGEIALPLDRFCRRLGMHRAAAEEIARLTSDDLSMLESYASGVNMFINTSAHNLPVEFTLLHLQPTLWQPVDTIQWAKVQGWSLGGNWETEVIRARIIAKLGLERAAQLEGGYDPDHPLIIPPGVSYEGINPGMLEQYHLLKELSGFGMLGGSNNWVVDGTMTASGTPILCNDPHLGQSAPSIWYECHLVAGDLDVVGASFPGAPGIIIGHNQHIAWGVTNAISDVQDLYIEKFHPEDSHLYEFQGHWEEARVVHEEIRVQGQEEPVIENVRITRHGPIISSFSTTGSADETGTAKGEVPLALRWVGLEQCTIISAVQKLNHATNWTSFRDALRDWDAPAQNFVYADQEGNIGYVMAGAIPIRAQGQALVPSPGWTGEYEWTGHIPFDELPQIYNPDQHLIVTANNRVVDDSYPYYITHEWLNGYRAERIRDLLTSKGKLTPADMAAIQADQYSLPAVEILPHLLSLNADTPLKRAAHEILRTWDYVLSTTSIAASLYTTFLRMLEDIIFGVVFGDDLALMQSYRGQGVNLLVALNGYYSRSTPLIIRLLKERDESWFAISAIPNGPTSWETALNRAFDATIEELRDRMGSNILRWQYGALHKMTYTHPLGALKVLAPYFNLGPFPVGGNADTVNTGCSAPTNPEDVVVVASYRQIIDVGNFASALSIHAPGQSGHPASKHYDDLLALWRENKHHPMLFTRSTIEATAEGTLHLLPRT